MFVRTTQEERAFEKRETARERDRKLDSDVIRKVAEDEWAALVARTTDGR